MNPVLPHDNRPPRRRSRLAVAASAAILLLAAMTTAARATPPSQLTLAVTKGGKAGRGARIVARTVDFGLPTPFVAHSIHSGPVEGASGIVEAHRYDIKEDAFFLVALTPDRAVVRARLSFDEKLTSGVTPTMMEDVDGDGHRDLAVRSLGPQQQPLEFGSVTVFSGARLSEALHASPPARASLPEIEFESNSGRRLLETGASALCGLDDLDGDGFDELLVGAPRLVRKKSLPNREYESIYIYWGSSDFFAPGEANRSALTTEVIGPTALITNAFGMNNVSLGDWDGDGRGDFAVLASGPGPIYFGIPGSVYLYRGSDFAKPAASAKPEVLQARDVAHRIVTFAIMEYPMVLFQLWDARPKTSRRLGMFCVGGWVNHAYNKYAFFSIPRETILDHGGKDLYVGTDLKVDALSRGQGHHQDMEYIGDLDGDGYGDMAGIPYFNGNNGLRIFFGREAGKAPLDRCELKMPGVPDGFVRATRNAIVRVTGPENGGDRFLVLWSLGSGAA